MATRHLPVIQERDPFERPRIVAHCENGNGIRPCPWVSCSLNLLTDCLEDGSLVLNFPSKRFAGAERPIPDRHAMDKQWFVEVRIPARRTPLREPGKSAVFAIGPLETAPRAKEIAAAWEIEHGENTTRVHRKIPKHLTRVGAERGAIDDKFDDEMEDAIEYWFDDPERQVKSCVLDEIKRLQEAKDRAESWDDEYLLEEIAGMFYVSRERIRQTEVSGLIKLKRDGLTLNDILDED